MWKTCEDRLAHWLPHSRCGTPTAQVSATAEACARPALLALLLALKYVPVVPNVLLFWLAFVLTRPFGATAGDLLTKPTTMGGLDLGTAGSSAVLLAVLFGLMGWAHLQERRNTLATASIS
ncbi:hypothetical protein [Microbispora catharanthi]|uniref:hypothetical protein n=1 Tax=Microbispora catharanthi TaxID=1712871 RepID=UPI00197B0FE4|nr:hypothetical protein [Microbispora catharanthi]